MFENKVNFIYGPQALYNAIPVKDNNTLYFIYDTQRVYKGDIDFSQSIIPVMNFPTTQIVSNKLYVNISTLETRIYEANEWRVISPGYVTTLEDFKNTANNGKTATVETIKAYIAEVIAAASENAFQGVDFDESTGSLNFSGSDPNVVVDSTQLEGVAHDPTWSDETLTIRIPIYGREDCVINIPKDQFLKDVYYDPRYHFEDEDRPALVFIFETTSGEVVRAIPIDDWINDYTASDTDGISVVIDTNHDITAKLKVGGPQASGYTEGKLAIVNDSKKKIYTSEITLNTNDSIPMGESNQNVPTAKIIAAAIATAVTELANHLLPHGNENEVVVSTEDGIQRSQVTIGGSAISYQPSDHVLATEAAVADAISWKTLA